MRRREVIYLVSLAGMTVFNGCADSPAPPQTTSRSEAQGSVKTAVVVAAHYESIPKFDTLLNETSVPLVSSIRTRSENIQRLPPLYPIPVAAPESRVASREQRTFQRLPELNCIASPPPRPYAIDLSEPETPVATPSAASPSQLTTLVPSIVKVVADKESPHEPVLPARRFVEPKAPKPPLGPITKQSIAAPSGSAGWLMTGTALVAVSQRADAMIERGFQLGQKGAYYSAQTEFKQALRTVSQALDAHFGGTHYSESLAAGWLALDEAADFAEQSKRGPAVDVGVIVESHQTPVLKDYALDDVSPVLAIQHYFSYAQEQLVEGCGRAPVASRALHGLGKIHMVLAEQSASAEQMHGPKAMAFHQAALTTDPSNYLAANELGVLLARFGKLPEARTVLQHSVAVCPLPETWRNLSVVHQRLGEAQYAAQSLANWQIALQQQGNQPVTQQADRRSMVQWVSPEAFAGDQNESPTLQPNPEPAMQPEQPIQAQKKSGFLWW
ncbi:MAG: hypothetical protein H6822_22855 [Planctomycetaceae bacterium]|nr:hypothetical protein [Planctomycetales bacterium]MCB9925036.1 hypothetical protein [Planctomycetaceae bacterium]